MTEAFEYASDEIGEGHTQPALATMQFNQRDLIDGGGTVEHGLRDGFPTLREAIKWRQRATIRTLGLLSSEFAPVDLARDRTLSAALVVGDERETLAEDPMGLEYAAEYRRRLEREFVLPACNRAYNSLRKRAGEYIDDDEHSQIDPREQAHVAMRPSVDRKDREQAHALRELWGGFSDRDELMDWVHRLNEPTNGAISSTLPAEIGRDPVAIEHMLADESDRAARRYRERFAAVVLLPAFVAGIRRMDGGEKISEETGPTGTFSFD